MCLYVTLLLEPRRTWVQDMLGECSSWRTVRRPWQMSARLDTFQGRWKVFQRFSRGKNMEWGKYILQRWTQYPRWTNHIFKHFHCHRSNEDPWCKRGVLGWREKGCWWRAFQLECQQIQSCWLGEGFSNCHKFQFLYASECIWWLLPKQELFRGDPLCMPEKRIFIFCQSKGQCNPIHSQPNSNNYHDTIYNFNLQLWHR